MVCLDGFPPLGLIPLLAFSIPSVSASVLSTVIINVVISQEVEVWRENPEGALRLCRPPDDKPWLGVFAIDPEVTSCQQEVEGSSPSWKLAQIDYEPGSQFIPIPGTLLSIQGPTGIPITNTKDPEDFFTYGNPNTVQQFHVSKWLVERFGNTNTFERLSKENPVKVGDTLRYWEEGTIGLKQLYLRRVKGNPQRLTRARPPVDRDAEDDFAAVLDQIRLEFPYAELRIASLGDSEIVGPGIPTRARKIINQIGRKGKSLLSLFKGISATKAQYEQRVRSPSGELSSDEEDFEVTRYPSGQGQGQQNRNPVQLAPGGQQDRWVMEDFIFEESKENNDDRIQVVDRVEQIPLRPAQNINNNVEQRINLQEPNIANDQIGNQADNAETIYQTALEGPIDYDEEDRLGDIVDAVDQANNRLAQ
ncbi:hypothetical protein ABW21_db0203687 [Orbilia brochopaga]|nr:hypothetical protein ABW21_db0203687 [Drechslerella brochopaga]